MRSESLGSLNNPRSLLPHPRDELSPAKPWRAGAPLTRPLQRMLESDKLQQNQEDRERELSANRREIGALQTCVLGLYILY